ncbi:hypothetical protein [Sphingomonas hankyongi]|uniref:Uncharacterized protein n=1 Tax=Sphingomonas hankyongi TaxID=2908209 RepID=A0ABT0S3P3_9SPHN|nr:hypothetical protein [Sphingomonas hankyongi]MCL6730249.1 hypothetical protein [Sphingomonas hankyongi]
MPMLGDLIAAARSSSNDFQAWLEGSDPDFARNVERAAARQRTTPTGFVRAAMADFSRFASEEDWATLTSSLRDTDDPGTVCLLAMVHWRLTVRGCSKHSQRPSHADLTEGRYHE